MNIKFWKWPENHREKLVQRKMQQSDEWITVMTTSLTEALRHTQIAVSANHHVTHAQRPPAPRPSRITVIYIMPDGQQYRQYIPLNGQPMWVESFPHFWNGMLPDRVEFHLGYSDGGI